MRFIIIALLACSFSSAFAQTFLAPVKGEKLPLSASSICKVNSERSLISVITESGQPEIWHAQGEAFEKVMDGSLDQDCRAWVTSGRVVFVLSAFSGQGKIYSWSPGNLQLIEEEVSVGYEFDSNLAKIGQERFCYLDRDYVLDQRHIKCSDGLGASYEYVDLKTAFPFDNWEVVMLKSFENKLLVFRGSTGAVDELLVGDAISSSLTKIEEINTPMSPLGDLSGPGVFFPADGGYYKTNGSIGGTVRFFDATSIASVFLTGEEAQLTDSRAIFKAFSDSTAERHDLWVSDGTVAGTQKLQVPSSFELNPNYNSPNIRVFNGKAYYSVKRETDIFDVWENDGTVPGNTLILSQEYIPSYSSNSVGLRRVSALGDSPGLILGGVSGEVGQLKYQPNLNGEYATLLPLQEKNSTSKLLGLYDIASTNNYIYFMGVDTKTNTFINRQYALWRLPRDLCPEDSQKVLPGFCGCGVAENYIETNGSLECSLAGVTVNFNTQDMSLKRSYFTGPKNNRQLNLRFEKWAPNFVSGLKKREVLVPRYELVAHKPVGGPGSSGLRELLATSDTPLFKKLNENAAGLYGGYRVALYIKNKSKPKKRPRLLFKTAVDLFASIKEP